MAIALGTLTFVGLGLALAGTLRAEAVLALANGLFLAFLMLGGIVLPVDQLPDALQSIAAYLPSTALADVLRIALDSGAAAAASPDANRPLVILAAWSAAVGPLAGRFFRWGD